MIEAAAPAGTITHAFSWLPRQARSARLFGAAADLRPDTTPWSGVSKVLRGSDADERASGFRKLMR
jgi:hypothetical protein